MTNRRWPHHWRGVARLGPVAIGLLLVFPGPAMAASGSAADPDDVSLRLDLKSVSHTNDGSSITYTAETYENFPDNVAAFKWGVDKNGDQAFDLIVYAEWEEGRIVAGVDDAAEESLGPAKASRPAANAIQVSFSRTVLGGVNSYRYSASAEDDRNGNGETDAGEQDVAPNSGMYQHDLASTASAQNPTSGPSTPPVAELPAPARPAAPQPATPQPVTSPSPVTGQVQPEAVAPKPPAAETVTPAPRAPAAVPVRPESPAAAPAAVPVRPQSPAAAAPATPAAPKLPAAVTAPSLPVTPEPAPGRPAGLARTGAASRLLVLLAGLLLSAGGLILLMESLVPPMRPRSQ